MEKIITEVVGEQTGHVDAAAFAELSELQLATIGGGMGEATPA